MNCARASEHADFPGYAEAVARENKVRGSACLGLNEVICGCEVKPLCPEHLGLLTFIRHPFHGGYTVDQLCGTKEKEFADAKPDLLADILRFLWIVSPMYKTGSVCGKQPLPPPFPKRRWFELPRHHRRRIVNIATRYATDCEAAKTPRDRFNEAFAPILKLPVHDVVKEILEYFEESFIDIDQKAPRDAKQYNAVQISIASELSENYPHSFRVDFWNPACPPEKNPLKVPLKIVAQLRKYRAVKAGNEVKNNSEDFIEAGLTAMNEREAKSREENEKVSRN